MAVGYTPQKLARYQSTNLGNRRKDSLADIPYQELARLLFRAADQVLVPFLGAGASRPSSVHPAPVPSVVDPSILTEFTERLAIGTAEARLLLEIAVAIALQLSQPQETSLLPGDAFRSLRESESVPNAADLAQALAERSSIDLFAETKARLFALTGRQDWEDATLTRLLQRLVPFIGTGSATTPLLDVASQSVDRRERDALRQDLRSLFENKRQPTSTHALVARATSCYLRENRDNFAADDFLIVTTNYDSLLEGALDKLDQPYCVVTVLNSEPPGVDLRLSANARDYLGFTDKQFSKFIERAAREGERRRSPAMFSGLLTKPRPLALIYKIHGSLDDNAMADADSVVITDEDYDRFTLNNVPSYFLSRLWRMSLLLLGYSLRDKNIRSLIRGFGNTVRQNSNSHYAVLLRPSQADAGFFRKHGINLLDVDLELFCKRLREFDDSAASPPPPGL